MMEKSKLRVIFLGDSITWGGCVDDINNSYLNRTIKHFGWEDVQSHSLPGSRIGNYIGEDPRKIGPSFVERYQDMPKGYDLVIVFGGTNDFGIGNEPMGTATDQTADTFYGALNLLITGLKEKYPDALIVFMTPIHRRNESEPNVFTGAVFKEYIEAIKDRVKAHGVLLLDLYKAKSLQPTEEYYEKMIRQDGIHPNDEGHRLIAEELITYLEDNCNICPENRA